MAELTYRIEDLGDRRVLTLQGTTYPPTRYSTRVIEMLIERKQERAPLYFPFKDERAPLYLDPLMRWLRARGARGLAVLEVGCSFGHMTEYLAEQPEIATISTFDVDRDFVAIVRTKVEEMELHKVREVTLLTNEESRRLPWRDGAFDLVLAIGVIEHLPADRRALVDEYYRVLAPGGHIAILDTPHRWFPYETHSIGLPFVQWLPPRLAYAYARLCRRGFRSVPYETFVADGTGWRNATLSECLPSSGWRGLEDVTEAAGYGWRFFPRTAGRRIRKLGPILEAMCGLARAVGQPPSVCLPYLNLLLRKTGT
ncbi:MAG: methyltransferase domain-containing protein [Candidatus Rokuibacteriota bacterium]